MINLFARALKKLQADGPLSLCKSILSYISRVYWRSDLQAHLRCWKFRLKGYRPVADPFKIIYVDPLEIRRHSPEFGPRESIGLISSGDWDKEANQLAELPKFKAVEAHFCKGVPWDETGVIDYLHNRIENEGALDGCRTRSDLVQRYEQIDQLYKNVQRHGYDENKHGPREYINVHIGREGEILFAGAGRHRLAISHVLELNKIPVMVKARHREWQERRQRIANAEEIDDLDPSDKKHINHPDIKELASFKS